MDISRQYSEDGNLSKVKIVRSTDLQVESSYLEDGLLNVLVSPKITPAEKPCESECRWTIVAKPQSKEITRIDFCIATNDGFEYPPYSPTRAQLKLFQHFVMECIDV